MNLYLNLTAAAFTIALLSGCSPQTPQEAKGGEVPVVSDENCRPENIKQIQDEKVRQTFADACARRGGFKASSGKNY
ncbi:MAG: entry exclusion lipoprotein TrbK [Proteobacteria bacterium]|nr:entry exclusion lipoprotein TrbK [Pseudomonadota bacterium]